MQAPSIDRSAVAIRRVHAVINPKSGSVTPGAAAELADLFAELGLDYRVTQLVPGACEDTLRAAIDAGPDLMVVLGGDGTASLVAEMCGPWGPLVAPLPGGTMNKLGHLLYGPRPWRAALLAALQRGEERWMPGGEVDGHVFYCSAVLGSPALWARSREAIRARKLRRAWRRAVLASRNAFEERVGYELDGQVGHGLAVGLINPTVSRALDEDEGALEAAVIDLPDAKAAARLIASSLFGDWRADPDVTIGTCVRGRVWGRHKIPAMLDGEFFRLPRQVQIRFNPRAFRALAPGADS